MDRYTQAFVEHSGFIILVAVAKVSLALRKLQFLLKSLSMNDIKVGILAVSSDKGLETDSHT